MRNLMYLASIILFFISCRKDDIIQPEDCYHYVEKFEPEFKPSSDYICARPDSWWEYDTGIIDTCKTGNFEVIDITHPNKCKIVTTTNMNLPYINSDVYWNNEKLLFIDEEATRKVKLIDDNETNLIYSYQGSYEQKIYIKNRYDSININETWYFDIIEVEDVRKVGIQGQNELVYLPSVTECRFYAKNIGLIKKIKEVFNFGGGTQFLDTLNLVNYYIAPQ